MSYTPLQRKNPNTRFERRWGLHAADVAQQEDTSIPAIHMRVHTYGSPFQRKARPTNIEDITGRTAPEWCHILGETLPSITGRWKTHGTVFYEQCQQRREAKGPIPNPGYLDNDTFWLMPQHPLWQVERDKFITYCRANNRGDLL